MEIIQSTITELGIEVRLTGNLGADQQTFTQTGVAATSIGATGNESHNPNDIIDQVNIESLQNVGLITSQIILKTMARQ